MGIETNRTTPAYLPRNSSALVLQPNQVNGVTFGPNNLSYDDDSVMGWNGVGSQLDGLGPIGKKGMYDECSKGEDMGTVTGLIKSIHAGDVVIFHTGWTRLLGKDDQRYNAAESGSGWDGARHLVRKGVAAQGSDTLGVEALPFEKSADVFEVHAIRIFQNGTFILENTFWRTS